MITFLPVSMYLQDTSKQAQENKQYIFEQYCLYCAKCETTILESISLVAFIVQKELVISIHSKECQGDKLKLE